MTAEDEAEMAQEALEEAEGASISRWPSIRQNVHELWHIDNDEHMGL